ncbi:MAG: hypothetical protein WKF77_15680 [Planctomycetaceae bacterium]
MTSADYTKISQGLVYDPLNDINGEVRDLWILDGRIVDARSTPRCSHHERLMPAGWSSCRAG